MSSVLIDNLDFEKVQVHNVHDEPQSARRIFGSRHSELCGSFVMRHRYSFSARGRRDPAFRALGSPALLAIPLIHGFQARKSS